jgi:antitoxin component YwqK of YwqJK toxin-antitoxin module
MLRLTGCALAAGLVIVVALLGTRWQWSEPEPRHGRIEYPAGVLYEEFTLDSKGQRHGISRLYYPDGTLKRETVFHHGSWQSFRAWWPNGKLQEECSPWILDDSTRKWDEDGTPILPPPR